MTNLSETYGTSAVGTGKILAVASYTINDGNGGNNYTVTTVANNTGVIAVQVPTQLAVYTQPSTTSHDGVQVIFAQQPVIEVLDQDGNLDFSDNTTQVTVAIHVGVGRSSERRRSPFRAALRPSPTITTTRQDDHPLVYRRVIGKDSIQFHHGQPGGGQRSRASPLRPTSPPQSRSPSP